MSNVIVVASEKGGVAKTTTALSLGGALVETGQEVLMIDLDPQASLTLSLGIPPHTVRRSVADVLINSVSPVSVSRETIIPGLDLVPSNSEMELAERFLPVRRDYKNILRDIIRDIQLYDTIIIDCPPSLGAVTSNAIVAADLLCIPTIPEYLSVYALRNLLNLIRSIREKNNPKLKYRILVTMLDQRINSHLALNKQIRSTFKEAVFKTIIQVDTRLRDAAIAGYPITHFASKSRSAEQYRALVQELGQYVRSEKVKQAA
jgi:chromosome partitioning protein